MDERPAKEPDYAQSKMTIEGAAGISVFYKGDDARVFHTYSCYARGFDMLSVAYHWLALEAKGRDETGPAKCPGSACTPNRGCDRALARGRRQTGGDDLPILQH
jgi:predicted dithiol-disulfide oxidoreductase (DUF899 family)